MESFCLFQFLIHLHFVFLINVQSLSIYKLLGSKHDVILSLFLGAEEESDWFEQPNGWIGKVVKRKTDIKKIDFPSELRLLNRLCCVYRLCCVHWPAVCSLLFFFSVIIFSTALNISSTAAVSLSATSDRSTSILDMTGR